MPPQSYTPLVVEPDHPVDFNTWTVRVGNDEVIRHSIPAKTEAIEIAKSELRGGSVVRPGIVVRNSDGSYQKFISNDRYWKTYVRPRQDWPK